MVQIAPKILRNFKNIVSMNSKISQLSYTFQDKNFSQNFPCFRSSLAFVMPLCKHYYVVFHLYCGYNVRVHVMLEQIQMLRLSIRFQQTFYLLRRTLRLLPFPFTAKIIACLSKFNTKDSVKMSVNCCSTTPKPLHACSVYFVIFLRLLKSIKIADLSVSQVCFMEFKINRDTSTKYVFD